MRFHSYKLVWAALLLGIGCLAAESARCAESLVKVAYTNKAGGTETRLGRVLVEAADGGVLLEDRAGQLWTITGEKKKSLTTTETPFQRLSADELGRKMLNELGEGFEIVRTDHYVICTDAGRPYAQWCGNLFERLLTAFLTHWRGKPLSLEKPDHPLPVIVFASRKEFARFAARDAGPDTAKSQGYYSVRTNRIVLYDLTAGPNAKPARTSADVARKVASSPFNVATVVHEATHQIGFNCGLHTRYADNPLWLTEGLAMYFETPDLRNRTGWRTIGKINRGRLKQFKKSLRGRRSPASLVTLIAKDDRLSTEATAKEAYAEAWALTYFLIKTHRRQYTEYLHRVSQKKPLLWNSPDERLKDFRAVFGGDLRKLDQEFLRYFARIR